MFGEMLTLPLKDAGRFINILALKECFRYGNVFQKWCKYFGKKRPFFSLKAQYFVQFRMYDFVQMSPACGPNIYIK